MADFETAFAFVLRNEGGLSENENDAGGLTNFGISLRFLKSIDPKPYPFIAGDLEVVIREMTIEQAKAIYFGEFWKHAPFDQIVNQQIGSYVFDCCVLHGISNGIKILQRAIGAAKRQPFYLVDDGIMGVKTLQAVNEGTFPLIYTLPCERAGFCRTVAALRNQNKEFLNGWLNRCYRI